MIHNDSFFYFPIENKDMKKSNERMFATIVNPSTKRVVKTSGTTGKKILQQYIQELAKQPKLYNYLKQKISCHS